MVFFTGYVQMLFRKNQFALVTAVALQIIDRSSHHDSPDPGTEFTFELILVKVQEHFYESLLQHILCIGHGLGIAIAYAKHASRIKVIQLLLSSRLAF